MKNFFLLTALTALVLSCHPRQKQVLTSSSGPDLTPAPVSFCAPKSVILNTPPGFDGTLTPLFAGLTEDFTYPITTKSKVAQKYFDQGLMFAYGFNHAEAARSFKEAARQDPDCAMCYWGLGYVLGPNYNSPMDVSVLPEANEAVAKAQMLSHTCNAKELALIGAISKRYPKTLEEDAKPFYQAYADALKEVHAKFPNDLDIAAMCAEALMDMHPWDLWEKTGEPKPWTPEITGIIEGVLKKNPKHAQSIHLYVHATEASGHAEQAVPYANTLRTLVPGSGHLVHMPSHTYINTGHYHEGRWANERAVKLDSAYVETCHVAGVYPLAYYPHNWHFLAACSALEGNGERALEASRYMANHVVNQEMMRIPDLTTLQHYLSIPWFIQVKFAMWDDILKEHAPEADLIYPLAIWHYARGMAFSGKGDFEASRRELAEVERLEKDTSITGLTIWGFNKLTDVTRIARHVLGGDIARRQGKFDASADLLRQAVAFEDQLQYQEPPDWFFSVRHLLGHVLFRAGKFAEAEAIYRQDLKKWKENGWALMGLYQCLKQQRKTDEARAVKARFDKAWQYASSPLTGSIL
ncbi:MAG: tetratricopeptide repeat protein [Bacteroidetes bacterium]|nr:tetratricopeptide repeat protein [Bacteroidota bacterium]